MADKLKIKITITGNRKGDQAHRWKGDKTRNKNKNKNIFRKTIKKRTDMRSKRR
jgi:hypothetical protein